MMKPVALVAVAAASLVGSAHALDPATAINVTVYHVYPNNYGAAPLNMDTADLPGDIYFDLRGVSAPLECAHPTARTAHDCDNPEVVAPNLVISKLTLTVAPVWSGYGRCNICVNGTDSHGNNTCNNGYYWCDCGDFGRGFKQCDAPVGRQNLSQWMGGRKCGGSEAQLWDCWKDAVAEKFVVNNPNGGFWYSSVSAGYCGDGPNANRPGCTWRLAEEVKRVNKTCSDGSINGVVEKRGKGCFSACSGVGVHRNTSEACWIKCFYATVLGPDSGTPGGAIAGMPIADIEAAWDAPFNSADAGRGGCPAMPGN